MVIEKQKKRRLRYEMPKIRRTSHWDLDYLPLKEIERLYGQGSEGVKSSKEERHPSRQFSKGKLGVVLMISGLSLIGLTILLIRL